MNKTHLVQQEEGILESGIQIRPSDPSSPAQDQVWINTAQQRLKYRHAGQNLALFYAPYASSLEIPPNGIIDCQKNESFYRSINSDFTIDLQNMVDGMRVRMSLTNTSLNAAEVTRITFPSALDIDGGEYFTISGPNNTNKYAVYYSIDDTVGSAPGLVGHEDVKVIITKGRNQETVIETPAASIISTGQHFFINSANDLTEYYVWFNKDALGFDPLTPGKTGIEVNIVGSDTNTSVANKVKLALDANADFSATVVNSVITVTNVDIGLSADPSNVNIDGGFTIEVTKTGALPDTSGAVADLTALALDGLADFTVSDPASNQIDVINTQNGYAADATNVSIGIGFTIAVLTQGTGRVLVSFAQNVKSADDITVVNGQSIKVFDIARIAGNYFVLESSQFSS